jgi:hypothetical protein
MKRRWIGWLFNRLLVALVLYAAVYTLLNLYLSSKIKAATKALHELGAAANEKEFQIPQHGGPDAGPYWRAAGELWQAVAEKAPGKSEQETARTKLIKAYALNEGQLRHKESLEPADQATIAELRSVVSQSEQLLSLLVTAAQRPGYRSTLDYGKGFALELPHLAQARDMAYLTRLAAELSILDGNRQQAIEYWTALRHLARWQAQDLTVIGQVVANWIEEVLCRSVQESLKVVEFSNEDLERLQTHFATGRDHEQDTFRSLDAEMIYGGLAWFDALIHGYQKPYNPGIRVHGAARLWVKANKAHYLALFSEFLAQTKATYDDNTPISTRKLGEPEFPWYAHLSAAMTPRVSRVFEKVLQAETAWRLTDCTLQLARYKIAHGQYPDSLSDLPAGAGSFIDPFAKKTLRYLPKGEGFVLYSVGPNLQDDGASLDDEHADIVVALTK